MAPPASRRVPPIERFLSRPPAPPAGSKAKRAKNEHDAFAAVLRSPELVREAQALFDQIATRGEPLGPPGAVADAPPMRVWALVAVVATGITRELKQEKAVAAAGAAGAVPTASWHLVQLLEDAGVSLLVFLQYFTSLFNRLLLDPELLEVTMLLKEEFTVASVLFEKYRLLWRKVAVGEEDDDDDDDDGSEPEQEQEHASSDENSSSNGQVAAIPECPRRRRRKHVFDAGWLLFLFAKRRLGAHYTGLGPLYYLLLAVLLLVAPQAGDGPSKALLDASPSLEAEVAAALSALGSHDVKEAAGPRTRRAAKRSISSVSSSTSTASTAAATPTVGTSGHILEALCAAPRVDPVEVTTALSHLKLVVKQLHERGELLVAMGSGHGAPDSLFGGGDGEDAQRSIAMGDALLHADVLEKNVAKLAAVYKQEYLDGCGKLDERLYLDPRTRQVITDGSGKSGAQRNAADHGESPSAAGSSATRSPARRTGTPARRQAAANLSSATSGAGQGRVPGPSSTATTRAMMTPPPRHQQPPAGFVSPLRHSSVSWQWQAAASPAVPAAGSTGVRSFLPFASTANQHYYRPSPAPTAFQTPVTAAVETNQWVRDTLAPAILRPVTPQLEAFFADCATNPSQRIARIVSDRARLLQSTRPRPPQSSVPSMLTSISASLAARGMATDGSSRSTPGAPGPPTGSSPMSAATPRESSARYSGVDGSLSRTRDLSTALFYRVLEAMVRSERTRLQTTDLSSLLNNDVFISALFACCLEALLKTHALVTLSFPSLLDTVRVRAFDFGATIESFVRHGGLPPALKQHMRDIENRILDCLVWRSDSGLFAPAASDASDAAANTNTNTTTTGPRRNGLRLFFRMALSRAASRIYRLGTLLGLDTRSLNQVWTAVKECVCAHQHDLLRDRHLDQVVLCSIYGVSKANRSDMTFRRVNEAYKQLQRPPHAPPPAFSARTVDEVIRDIKLDDRGARGDIIKFYNCCYMPVMKVLLLQFQMLDKQLAAADAAGAVAAGSSPSSSSSHSPAAPPGFTPRVPGAVPAAATVSDADIVADAALEAVDRFLAARSARPAASGAGSANGTPPRSASASSSPSALFSSAAEAQTLPVAVAMRNTSPRRVPASNVYMSPLQQVRLNRRSQTLTPRSHALYAFGESPARDLALINRAVNAAPVGMRRTEHASLAASLVSGDDDSDEDASEAGRRKASEMKVEEEEEEEESEEEGDGSERSSSSTSRSVAIAALGSKRRRTR